MTTHPRYFSNEANNSELSTGARAATGDINVSSINFSIRSSARVREEDTYAVALISQDQDQVTVNNLKLEEILKEAPGTHSRDFFSLSLTSIGDAAFRKQRSLLSHYSANVKIHPWFILPRESEIAISFGCLRAIVTREKTLLFDAHRPTIRQHAIRINESFNRKDAFTLTDGQIIFPLGSKKNINHFELNMVEEIIREVCTMYLRRVRLYEPIVRITWKSVRL